MAEKPYIYPKAGESNADYQKRVKDLGGRSFHQGQDPTSVWRKDQKGWEAGAGGSPPGGGSGGGDGGGGGPIVTSPPSAPSSPSGGGGGGGGDMNTGTATIAGMSRFRQGIGQRMPPMQSASLAALRKIY